MHRNISNIILPTDLNAQSVIEFAIKHLQVRHIIVTGHYNCGGVKLALSCQCVDLMNPWIRSLRDVYFQNKKKIDKLKTFQEKHDMLVELNVYESCISLMKNMNYLENYRKYGFPIIRGCVYDLRHGVLKEIFLDFEEKIKNYMKVYYLKPKD